MHEKTAESVKNLVNCISIQYYPFDTVPRHYSSLLDNQEPEMNAFINGFYVGHEIYPGVYAEERVGLQWMIRKEDERGWPCRVGEIKVDVEQNVYLARDPLGGEKGRAATLLTAVRLLLN